ncbi:MAG: hypothetical protein QW303_04810 [Nitrososphaerota archaeon]
MKPYIIKIKKIKIYPLNIMFSIFLLISIFLPWGYLSPFRPNISLSLYEVVKDDIDNMDILFNTLIIPPIQGTVSVIAFFSFLFIIIGGILFIFFRGGAILVSSGIIMGFIALILTPLPLEGSKIFDVGFYIGFFSLIISVFFNFIVFKEEKKEEVLPLPLVETPVAPPLSLSLLIGPACPKCNRATIYVSEYQKYYCQYCEEYIS